MLDLQQLRYFVAVAETGNVGRAAAKLHISQSPLSRRILQLEERLGLALFLRAKKRLQLTGAGRALLRDARQLLENAERVEQRARDSAAGAAGSLVIGYVAGAMHTGVLQKDLQHLRRVAPLARIELNAMRSNEQIEALQHGRIDVAYTHAEPMPGAGLRCQRLVEEPFVLAMPKDHPLALLRTRPRAAQLDGQCFVSLPEAVAPQARRELLAACRAAGFEPDIRYEALEPATVLGLVEAGMGLSIVQASLGRNVPEGVRLVPLPARFAMRLRVYRVSPLPASPLVERLCVDIEPQV